MRILFCNFEYPPLGGGGGVINALLAEELAKRHEVVVLTSRSLGLPTESQMNGVRIIRVPVFFRRQLAAANIPSMLAYLPMGIIAGREFLKNERIDVINTHFALPSGPVGNSLAKFAGVPNVLSLHGGDLYDPSKWTSPHRHGLLRAWIRVLISNADRIIEQSCNTLQNVHSFYVPDLQASLIPLGIKRPAIEYASRQQFGFCEKDVLLVTVGRLVARKAVDQLIFLLKNLNLQNAHLLIIGSGPLEEALRKKATELQIDTQVRFLGHVDEVDKFKILHMSDLFVSASQHEGFGLVFLEAMACSLPVVCYDCGGQTDFLKSQQTGYVVTLNDLVTFTACCQILVHDKQLRARIGAENRRRVEEFFIDRCAARYEDLFSEVIEEFKSRQAYGYSHRS